MRKWNELPLLCARFAFIRSMLLWRSIPSLIICLFNEKVYEKELHYFPATAISKCRKWHLRGTYLKFFPGPACHRTSIEAHTCGDHMGTAMLGQKPPSFSCQSWNEGLDGVNWQLTNSQKSNWQLTFVEGFTDNWQRLQPLIFLWNSWKITYCGWNVTTLTFLM